MPSPNTPVHRFRLWLSLILPLSGFCHAADYHIDSAGGDDTRSGTSPAQAWKSLARANAAKLEPGDRLLLRAGGVYRGQLAPQGSGAAGKPIRVTRYGEGSKPLLDGGGTSDGGGFYGQEGKSGSVVFLKNQSHWEISDLEITNRGEKADYRRGLRVEIDAPGECRHIHLRNLVVRDINGLNKSRGGAHHELSKQSGGIFLCVTGEDRSSRFSDILIEGCVVRHCDRSGISVGARKHWYPEWNKLLEPDLVPMVMHRDIVIRNNAVEDLGGDGIVVQYAYRPLIEYNVCKNAAARSHKEGQYSAGIWPWMCEEALFQFNEASFTRSLLDGQGFDCDSGRGTVYQFNYSHDNEGGFMLFCQGSSRDSIVRYNVSRNDRFALFTNSGGTALVHNNVFHIGKGLDTDVNFPGASGKMRIFNNIFVNEGGRKSPKWGPYQYEANFYQGFDTLPDDPRKLTGDPGFADAAGAGARPPAPLADLKSWSAVLAGYKLRPGSPCLVRGIALPATTIPVRRDLWGNPLPQGAPNLGVWEQTRKR